MLISVNKKRKKKWDPDTSYHYFSNKTNFRNWWGVGAKISRVMQAAEKNNYKAQKSRYVSEKQKERSRKNWIGDIDDMLCEDNLEREHN